jgi:phosphatidate cytidylyltransferase
MLLQRFLAALVLIPPALAAVWFLPNEGFAAILAGIFLIAAWEWGGLMQLETRTRAAFLVMISVGLGGFYLLRAEKDVLTLLLLVAFAWWCVAFVWILRYPAGLAAAQPRRMAKAIVGLLVLLPSFVALVLIHARTSQGALWFLSLLVLVWAADTGAYFAGRAFGRHKMAPRVSPGKTWEGALGGFVLAGIVSALAGMLVFHIEGLELILFILVCLAVVAFSIVGDLTESMFKRHIGVKDSGNLIPGHGGVLDRLDSLFAAAPLYLGGLLLLGI